MPVTRRTTLAVALWLVAACRGSSGDPLRDAVAPGDARLSCIAAVVAQHDCVHHYRFVGDDGVTELGMLLLPGHFADPPLYRPTKGTDAFALVAAAGIYPDGWPFCVTDKAYLDWESSHHNWTDRATVIDGGYTLSYQEDSVGGDTKTYQLRVEQRRNSQLIAEIALQYVDCVAKGRDWTQQSCLAGSSKFCGRQPDGGLE
jgi:hypothetical protein